MVSKGGKLIAAVTNEGAGLALVWWFLNVRYVHGYNHILTYLRQHVESIWIWWHFICIQVLWAAIRRSSVLAQGKHGKRYLRTGDLTMVTFGRKVSNTFPCSLKTDFFRFIALIYNHLIRPQKQNSHLFWTNSTFPREMGIFSELYLPVNQQFQ